MALETIADRHGHLFGRLTVRFEHQMADDRLSRHGHEAVPSTMIGGREVLRAGRADAGALAMESQRTTPSGELRVEPLERRAVTFGDPSYPDILAPHAWSIS